ncbi:MAG TPA: ankyrin repeat domain-containing protein [Vicinamibacterales bacterium]|nr:ankyrin repeat domain-containing protein [Vicinamibacterales bacterium]
MRLRGLARAAAFAACAAMSIHVSADGARVADAAMSADVRAVRALLTAGEDVNAAQGDGMTALHWAARRGDLEMVRMLLAAGGHVRAATRLGGYTPLLLASQNGHAEVIEALAAAGADVKTATSAGVTALMLASAAGQVPAVDALIKHGAEVNAAEPTRGETALMFAAANRRADVVRALIAAKADINIATKVVSLRAAPPSPEEEAYLAAVAAGRAGRPSTGSGQGPSTGSAPAPSTNAGQAPGSTPVPAPGGRQAATPAMPAPSGAPAPGAPGQGDAQSSAPANAAQGGRRGGGRGAAAGIAGVSRPYTYAELINGQGGLTALLFAVRQGDAASALALLDAGAPIDQPTGGDGTSPLLLAVINGHFDLAAALLERGANPSLASDNGVTPLYAALNVQWAPRALYPQPRTYLQQKLTYLELMKKLLEKGVDPNVRLTKKVWYQEYNFPLLGVDEIGATPFWRAAYAADVEAMKLLVANGADPNVPTIKPAGRPRTGDAAGRETIEDISGLPPVPIAGPGIPPLQAAAGSGYGEGFAGNSHRTAPGGFLPAVTYLVEELHADVNGRDHEGNTALHHAAARGDVPMIEYLVSKGADVKAVNRAGETTADMANSPVSRIEPYPEAIALLVKLGAKNNGKCKACS